MLENLLLTLISPHIVLSDSQHGFRSVRSTTSALLPLVQQIATGFNQHYPIHRTVSMAVDFSKAFDTVNHTHLLTDIHNTTMTHNTIRWLTTYLRGRTAICKYNHTYSKPYPLHTGVPQGSVLSPLLFNLYVSSYPKQSNYLPHMRTILQPRSRRSPPWRPRPHWPLTRPMSRAGPRTERYKSPLKNPPLHFSAPKPGS